MTQQSEKVAHATLVSGTDTTQHSHKLNSCSVPDGNIDFNQKQVISLVIENRTTDPGSPVNGQIWLRTDL